MARKVNSTIIVVIWCLFGSLFFFTNFDDPLGMVQRLLSGPLHLLPSSLPQKVDSPPKEQTHHTISHEQFDMLGFTVEQHEAEIVELFELDRRIGATFELLDRNADKLLSFTEWSNGKDGDQWTGRFLEFDTNLDGLLSLDEFLREYIDTELGRILPRKFLALDTNPKDRKLTALELADFFALNPGQMDAIFEKWDADGDGQLAMREFVQFYIHRVVGMALASGIMFQPGDSLKFNIESYWEY